MRSRRERRVSPFGKKNEKVDYVEAENAPEERRVAPNPRATLSVHVVASPASHGALEGGGLSVRSLSGAKQRDYHRMCLDGSRLGEF